MCGIVGMLVAAGAHPPERTRLAQAVGAMRHRGPDGSGMHVDGAVALGHTRLSIIDVEGGAQPLANEDGSVLTVFNGEIWNHRELRRDLERAGHTFRTRCDTEVLVHGYEEWGDDLPVRLDGMFAFAIWDSVRGRLLLARDRAGKKPLYVHMTPGGLSFGSDARAALLVAGTAPRPDPDGVAAFLFQRYSVAPRTMFAGVERLPAGQLVTYDGRTSPARRAYWTLRPPDQPESLTPSELRSLLRSAVEARLMSDVPLGVLLSGGVDSSAVLGLTREAGAEHLDTFTIGFSDTVYDERPLARLAAERHGSTHHEVVVDGTSFAAALTRLAWYRDEAIAEPSEVPLLLLAEFAATRVKVTLGGDAGDELFGGYPKYRAERALRVLGPGAVLARSAGVRLRTGRRTHRRLERAVETLGVSDELLRWASWFRTFSPAEVQDLLDPSLADRATSERLVAPLGSVVATYAGLDAGRRMLLGDFHTYLPDNMLLRTDKVLMAASLEGRVPLLDRAVVERVSAAPVADRIGWRRGKGLLRAAVADLVPRAVLEAPKRGFPVPVARMLREGEGCALESMLLSEHALSRGLLRADAVRELVQGDATVSHRDLKLFTLISLELWMRANVDRIMLTPPETPHELLGPADDRGAPKRQARAEPAGARGPVSSGP